MVGGVLELAIEALVTLRRLSLGLDGRSLSHSSSLLPSVSMIGTSLGQVHEALLTGLGSSDWV